MEKLSLEKGLRFYVAEGGWSPIHKVLHPTELTGTILSPAHIGVAWETIPGNQPSTNHNLLALWQNEGIPWGQPTLQTAPIIKNEPVGDQIFDIEIQRKPYIVAYGTNSNTTTAWAATLQFHPGNVVGRPFVTSVDVLAVGNDSLLATFETPRGNNPSHHGNWLGLWEGPVVTFDGQNQLAHVPVQSTTAAGSQTLNGLSLKIDTTYSLGYAVGDKPTDLAAWMSFTTASF